MIKTIIANAVKDIKDEVDNTVIEKKNEATTYIKPVCRNRYRVFYKEISGFNSYQIKETHNGKNNLR